MKQTLNQNLETGETEASKNKKDTFVMRTGREKNGSTGQEKAYNKKQKMIGAEHVCMRIISGSFGSSVIHTLTVTTHI